MTRCCRQGRRFQLLLPLVTSAATLKPIAMALHRVCTRATWASGAANGVMSRPAGPGELANHHTSVGAVQSAAPLLFVCAAQRTPMSFVAGHIDGFSAGRQNCGACVQGAAALRRGCGARRTSPAALPSNFVATCRASSALMAQGTSSGLHADGILCLQWTSGVLR